jgi:hypothetical protein
MVTGRRYKAIHAIHLGDAVSVLGITLMIFPSFMKWNGVLVLAATALARTAAHFMAWSAC